MAAAIALISCRQTPAANPPPNPATAGTDATTNPKPHGDHNPHHGGVVLMKGDLHYEAVFDPTGRAHHVYFSDAVREDLPASVASAVALTIKREKTPEETIELRIDEAGESWIGSSRPIDHPETTSVRVSFTMAGEPYWIDVPFASPAPAAPSSR
jgi:hypothetical protein